MRFFKVVIMGLYLVYKNVQTCNLQQASEYLNIGRFFFSQNVSSQLTYRNIFNYRRWGTPRHIPVPIHDARYQNSNRTHGECNSRALMLSRPARWHCTTSTTEERSGKDDEGGGGKVPGLAWRGSTNIWKACYINPYPANVENMVIS